MIFAKAEAGPVFFKDMSYYVMPHILADDAFLDRVTHSFLIRDPKASMVSYAKLDPGCHAGRDRPRGAVAACRASHWRGASARGDAERGGAGRLRSADAPLLACGRPSRHARKRCDWSDEAPQDWQQVSGWHQDVLSSKGVRRLTDEKVREVAADYEKLICQYPRFKEIYEHHLPFYDRLLAFALRCGRRRKDPASLALDH